MEIWDAYLPNGILAGCDLVRGEPIPNGLYHLVSEILVRHTDGDYLLMQRDFRKPNYGGYFEATAGGSALKGEDAYFCAKRELREETGIDAGTLTNIGRFVSHDTIYENFLCVTDCDKSSVKLQEGETVSYKSTKEEREEMEARKQRESLADGDMVWRMPYKQYKDHYSDCETIKGSYEFDERKGSFIEVIIRAGRLKNSGVRGEHFSGYQFRTDDEKLVCYRAVSEENARKQMKKDFPQSDESWECVQIFRYATHKTW